MKNMKKGIRKLREKKIKIQENFDNWLHHHYRRKRYLIFAFTIIVLIALYLFKDSNVWLRFISAIAFLALFYTIDHYFDIRFNWTHYTFIIIIAVGSLLLSPLYFIYPQYDKIQHFVQPIFIASMIFYMIDKLKIEIKWKIVFTFFVVIGILALFEMAEYALDLLFDWKLQGVYLRDSAGLEKFNLLMNPLDDTIIDLLFGVLGAFFYGIYITIYLKYFKKTLKLKR
jgi:hypothetical protein